MILQAQLFYDQDQREIEEVSLVDGVGSVFNTGFKDYPEYIAGVDFTYLAVFDIPLPVAEGPMGIPLLVMKRIRMPILKVTTLQEAFNQFDVVRANFDKWLNDQVKSTQSKLVVPDQMTQNKLKLATV